MAGKKKEVVLDEDEFLDDETLVPCKQCKKDCFAYRCDGMCDCLVNTDFNKECPFYTSKKVRDKQLKDEMKRKKKSA